MRFNLACLHEAFAYVGVEMLGSTVSCQRTLPGKKQCFRRGNKPNVATIFSFSHNVF